MLTSSIAKINVLNPNFFFVIMSLLSFFTPETELSKLSTCKSMILLPLGIWGSDWLSKFLFELDIHYFRLILHKFLG